MRLVRFIEEMKKLSITFLFLIILVNNGFAQQDPLFSQYMFNFLSFNPGSSGISGMICATALNRQQWVGFKGAPVTTVFNISAPVSLFHASSGVGLVVESDKTGFDNNISLSGSYSYIMDVGQGRLGLGLNLGMLNMALSPDWQIPQGDAHTPATGDPLIPETKESYVAFDAGIGFQLHI
jgi:type IX secretion system PorP/SprF family membrane protein